ncbi:MULTISPECIES: hypothetical protein [unclassified Microcoleus]|uniref:hypothetical protein n=1 Tax=unclassified Microcoleus TaxID=2642155 RepID=UPI002FCF2BBE
MNVEQPETVVMIESIVYKSNGFAIEEARQNLIEALELFFGTADPSEVKNRLHSDRP